MASSLLQQLLSLLLLLLPSPLRLREHLSGNHPVSANNFHPIFLVAGMSCSDLEARLTEEYRPSVPHCGAMKGKGWFGLWKNSSELLSRDYMQCFEEQMSLVYDPDINEYRNLAGVETRVPNFGSTRAFSYKNPLKSDWCLGKLRAALEDMGYRDGDTMFGAPTTSATRRRPPARRPRCTPATSRSCWSWSRPRARGPGRRPSSSATASAVWSRSSSSGFLEPVRNFASGTDIHYVPATTPLATRAMWRSFESAIVNFPSPAVFGRLQAPLVITRERNYSASAQDMERFLAAVGSGEAAEPFRRRAVPKMSSFAAPMVPMTYISGVGNRTPLRLVFWGDDFDAGPEAVAYGDGDGKINSISGLAFEKEMRRQPEQKKQFKSIKINKAQHSTIVTDDFALHRVIQEIVEANNQKIPS
ncbi:Lecithin-cholesterol acyltransferase-like 1 [Zea mays]|uniref:Lecithin-cholesterol acyltransferase-like 1 n=1 Tax=Zea mays TaxID=4577 RepID=A0A1D6EM74_MAIZE|nr:Lecithin-cholesterol acyltransferase-like 1 [Zea mays]